LKIALGSSHLNLTMPSIVSDGVKLEATHLTPDISEGYGFRWRRCKRWPIPVACI